MTARCRGWHTGPIAPGPPRPSASPPRQARSRASTERLLDAAQALVAEGGYAEATLAAIGARAGYSRGLVSTRFGSKEALLWALVERVTKGWVWGLIDPPDAGTGLEQLVASIDRIADDALADPVGLRVLQRLIFEATGPATALQEQFTRSLRAMHDGLATMIRHGIADGSIRADVDARLEAQLLLATLRGISYQWFLYPDDVDLRRLHDGLVDHMVRHLGTSVNSAARRCPAPRDRR